MLPTLTGFLYLSDLCPKPNDTRNALSQKSHVEELEGIPGLFAALTAEADEEEDWTIFTFPIDFDSALYGTAKDVKFYLSKCIKLKVYFGLAKIRFSMALILKME